MILQALTQYYETLLEKGAISPPGWDDQFSVSFGLELAPDGTLIQLIPFKETVQRGKKEVEVPRTMRVPAHVKRSSGVAANFLCDTSSYMLGADAKGKPQRALECFAANRALHQQILADADTPAAHAILSFFAAWDPAAAAAHPLLAPYWKEITTGANLIFCTDLEPVTSDEAICRAWQAYYSSADDNAPTAQCLVTGRTAPIAVLHPSIKGVTGAQSMGASLVSFNAPAFESYGQSQGMNAPVSEYAAFAYTTALNALLSDREHRRTIGDTTVVCWAQSGQSAYQGFGMEALFGDTQSQVRGMLEQLSRGERCDWQGCLLDPAEHFYLLGLSPNAARLSVRFFLQDTFGGFAENLNRHYEDIAVVRPAYETFETLPVWRLLGETVNQNSRNKEASPQLAGELLRAILLDLPYPATLLNGVQLRIRADREVSWGRAAIIKGYYHRLWRKGRSADTMPKEDILQMELSENYNNTAYTLGRLFSLYEQIQEAANPGINATIKDKYFTSAACTPGIIFPQLGNLAQKHLRVIRRTKAGLAVNFEKRLGELMNLVGETFPVRQDLHQQGSFQLGYYFENQARYLKKEQ